MSYYKTNIETKTLSNVNYRKVLHTTKEMQLVIMSIPVNGDIPLEKHTSISQFIRVEAGKAKSVVDGKKVLLNPNDVIIIPANTLHQITNIGKTPLKLYTIYSFTNKPEHKPSLVQKNQPDA